MASKNTASSGFQPLEVSAEDRSAYPGFRPIEVEFSEPSVSRERPEAPKVPATTPASAPKEPKESAPTDKKEK